MWHFLSFTVTQLTIYIWTYFEHVEIEIKREINQKDFEIVDLHFVKSE